MGYALGMPLRLERHLPAESEVFRALHRAARRTSRPRPLFADGQHVNSLDHQVHGVANLQAQIIYRLCRQHGCHVVRHLNFELHQRHYVTALQRLDLSDQVVAWPYFIGVPPLAMGRQSMLPGLAVNQCLHALSNQGRATVTFV